MARTFTSGNRLSITSPAAWTSAGSVFWRFKPSWNGADSVWHSCWSLFKSATDARCHFEQYSNNTIYAGWYAPGVDSRISLSGSGQFTSGTWANWLLTWDSATPLTTLYKNNSSVGSSNGSLSFVTFTPAALTVGADWEMNTASDGDIAEYARWDHVLDSTERALLESTGNPACLSTGLLHHYKILGNDSPEPDEIGSEDLTIIGTPAQATHPTVGSCGSTYTLTAATGSFTETGQVANLLFGRKVSAATGAFAHTGQDAALKLDRKLIANAGAFTETGQDVGLLYGRRLGADAGAFIFAGQDATLRKGYAISAGTGAFLLTGQDALLKAARLLSAGVGVFVLTGRAADLQYSGNLQVPGINLTVSDSAVLNLTTTDSAVLTLTVDDTLATG